MMKLKTLVQDLDVQIKGKKDIEITGVSSHSKQVAPGVLFIAKKGSKTDGLLFVEEAIQAGASAIVTDLYNPFLSHIVQVVTPSPQALEAEIAKRFYKDPTAQLFLIGVTGTNGKTTTTYLIRHLLGERLCGLIGTVENIMGTTRVPSTLTTPDVVTLNSYFHEMLRQGCKHAVMEVSSHALVQERVKGLEFDVAVFTNLGQDHLDYHKTLDAYGAAKQMLFKHLGEDSHKNFAKVAVINGDDPYADTILPCVKTSAITYGIENKKVALRAHDIKISPQGSEWILSYRDQSHKVRSPLIGRFNIYNSLAAVGVALAYGMSLEEIADKLRKSPHVPGRLEKISCSKKIHVYVDFAHTHQAMENILHTLRELSCGKVIVVFGCGGDRDKDKRPKMAAVAEKLGDLVVLTSDNPRGEDPLEIIKEMQQGMQYPNKAIVEIDRKKAIGKAISLATAQDIVVIAGKGHESLQIFKDKTQYFSDKEAVREIFAS